MEVRRDQIADVLKQAAIQEGQLTEKRQLSSEVGISERPG
jgi:hypothetical protein